MKLLHKLCPVTVICSYIYNICLVLYTQFLILHRYMLFTLSSLQWPSVQRAPFYPDAGSIVENRADLYDGEEPCPTQIYRERY